MLKEIGLTFLLPYAHCVENMILAAMKERSENHKRKNPQRITMEETLHF